MPIVVIAVIALLFFVFAFIGSLIEDIYFHFSPLFKIALIGGCFYGCYYFFKAGKEFSKKEYTLIKKDEPMTDKKIPTTNVPGVPTFNLSDLNLLELDRELRTSLKSNSSSFIFIRERENKKLKLQKEKVEIILDTIRALTLTQRELGNFQAETFLSNKLLEAVIAGKQEEIRNLAGLKKEEFLFKHAQIGDAIKGITDEAELRKEQVRSLKIANDRAVAELRSTEIRNEILDYIKQNINPADLKSHHKAKLMEIAINPQGIQTMDLETLEEVKGIIVEEQRTQLRKSKAEASIVETQADVSKATGELAKADISLVKSNRDSLKR